VVWTFTHGTLFFKEPKEIQRKPERNPKKTRKNPKEPEKTQKTQKTPSLPLGSRRGSEETPVRGSHLRTFGIRGDAMEPFLITLLRLLKCVTVLKRVTPFRGSPLEDPHTF
jgi:hypothetical protein